MKSIKKTSKHSLCILLASGGIAKQSEVTEAQEYAYFQGQLDALNGDVRIKRNQDSCWIWAKSPWDFDKAPSYDPLFQCK